MVRRSTTEHGFTQPEVVRGSQRLGPASGAVGKRDPDDWCHMGR